MSWKVPVPSWKKWRSTPKSRRKQLRKDGDPETAFKNAAQIIERTYNAPFLAHNCMEPMNFFAHVTDEKAVLAGPLQAPGWVEPTLSKLLNLPADKIEIQMTRMGGGFGRRAYAHYMYEAALISKKVKAPIKLIYTREDDMTYGIYRPMYTATYRAALDANKNLIGFHVKGGGIPEHPIHANRFPAGAVDNYLAEGWEIPSNITIGAFRAPRSNFNAAAEQSFLDEVAEAMGKDPIEFRLELLETGQAKIRLAKTMTMMPTGTRVYSHWYATNRAGTGGQGWQVQPGRGGLFLSQLLRGPRGRYGDPRWRTLRGAGIQRDGLWYRGKPRLGHQYGAGSGGGRHRQCLLRGLVHKNGAAAAKQLSQLPPHSAQRSSQEDRGTLCGKRHRPNRIGRTAFPTGVWRGSQCLVQDYRQATL